MTRPSESLASFPRWSLRKRVLAIGAATVWSLAVIWVGVTWVVRWVLTGVAAISSTGWIVLSIIAAVVVIVVSFVGENRYRRGGSR